MERYHRPGRYARLFLVVTFSVSLIVGLAPLRASAAQDGSVTTFVATAGFNCNSYMDDEDPRYFIVYTIEDVPNSPFQGGGVTWGFVWVDRRVDGRGYDVCVGWPTGGADDPYAWQARVMDNEPDGHGAIPFVTYVKWNGTERIRDYLPDARADGDGHTTGYNVLGFGIKDFYVGVCVIKAGVKTGCNDERGED
jgi:hypothetical protein